MLEREIPVVNRLGLHARAAARLVQLLAGFQSRATLIGGGREVNAKSIMGVLLLAADVVLINAAADLLQRLLDPRPRR